MLREGRISRTFGVSLSVFIATQVCAILLVLYLATYKRYPAFSSWFEAALAINLLLLGALIGYTWQKISISIRSLCVLTPLLFIGSTAVCAIIGIIHSHPIAIAIFAVLLSALVIYGPFFVGRKIARRRGQGDGSDS